MEQNKDNIVYDIDKDITKKGVVSPTLLLRKSNNSSENNISQLNNNVKSDISHNYDMQVKENYVVLDDKELKNISGGLNMFLWFRILYRREIF